MTSLLNSYLTIEISSDEFLLAIQLFFYVSFFLLEMYVCVCVCVCVCKIYLCVTMKYMYTYIDMEEKLHILEYTENKVPNKGRKLISKYRDVNRNFLCHLPLEPK